MKMKLIAVAVMAMAMVGMWAEDNDLAGRATDGKDPKAPPAETVLKTNVATLVQAPVSKVYWNVADAGYVALTLATNLTVNWTTVGEEPSPQDAGRATVPFDTLKQVGTIQTNRVLISVHEGSTNGILLKVLGLQDWPSERRVIRVPRKG